MYKTRREKVFKELKDNSLLIIHSGIAPKKSADQKYPFNVNRNFYYLTGIDQEDSYLVLAKGADLEKEYLFIEPYSKLKALWEGEVLSFDVAKEISQVDQVIGNTKLINQISTFLSPTRGAIFGEIKNVYFDLEKLNLTEDDSVAHKLAIKLNKNYPYLNIETITAHLSYLRSIKDESEVALIQQAIDITEEAIINLYQNAEPGLTENQIEAFYNFVLNWHGVTPSFDTIAASGVNGTVLHYSKNNDLTQDGDLILFDLGVSFRNYCSDISRTFPVNGKFTKRQKEIYEIVLHTNKEVIKMLKPGVTFKEFNEYAEKLLAEGLMKIGKIERKEELRQYYYHSIGHFLGLDVHDVGDYTRPFEKGQILTVEPGLYLADENIGIRIEDNILITEDGYINLSENIPKEIKDIEKIMNKE